MKKRLGRLALVLSIVLAALVGIGFWSVDNVLPYSIVRPWKRAAHETPADLGLLAEHLSLDGFDAVRINAWLVCPKLDTVFPNTVIFLHGIGNNCSAFNRTAALLADHGWNSVLIDLRAHGESGGEFCTFGFYEEKDLARVVDFLEKERPERCRKLGVWGKSLGGAIALQCLENDPRLDFGIIESTFTDLPTIVSDYQKRYALGIRLPWASGRALEKAGEIAHFDPQTVRPLESARNIRQPVLLAHGDADERISFEYGQRIYENLASADKEFVAVHGAHHNDVHRVGGKAYMEKCLAFLDRQRFME